ncbi:hypothetical protein [Aliikangiella sp. IMCC44632]
MKKTSKTVLAGFIIFISHIVSTSADEMFVFIGEYIDVKEWPYSDEYLSECNCIVMDFRFKAKYKVLKVLHGDYPKNEVTFTVHDHYGFPGFAKQKTSIIYLVKSKDHFAHLKYAWDSVSPLKGGGFASCEDETGLDEEHYDKIKDYNFSPPIEIDLRHASEYVINEYKNDPLYKVSGEKAVCVRGVAAEDLFEISWPEVIEDYKLDKNELVKKDNKSVNVDSSKNTLLELH